MPRTKPFSELRRKVPATPERQERSVQRRAMDVGLALGKLQEECRPENDNNLDITFLEHQEDVYLATLRNAIELLGGKLEITAVFPDRDVRMVPTDED